MADQFIRDRRGAIPAYVITDGEDGVAIVKNQFTGKFEVIGERPYSDREAAEAARELWRRENPEIRRAYESSKEDR